MSRHQVLWNILNFDSLQRLKQPTPSRDEVRLLDFGELTGAICSVFGTGSYDKALFVDLADYYLELGVVAGNAVSYEAALFSLRWSQEGELADTFLHRCHGMIGEAVEDWPVWLHLAATGVQKGFTLPKLGEILLPFLEKESNCPDVNDEALFIAFEIMEVWLERNPGRFEEHSIAKLMRCSRTEMGLEEFLSSRVIVNGCFKVLLAGTFLHAQDDLYHLENAVAIDKFVSELDKAVGNPVEAAIAGRIILIALKTRPDSFRIPQSRIDVVFVNDDTKFHASLLVLLSGCLNESVLRKRWILQKLQLDPIECSDTWRVVHNLRRIPHQFCEQLKKYFQMCNEMGFQREEYSIESKLIEAFKEEEEEVRSSENGIHTFPGQRELILEKRHENVTAGALHIIMGEASLEFKANWIKRLDFRGTEEEVKIHATAFHYMEDDPEDTLVSAEDAERLQGTMNRWLTETFDQELCSAICEMPFEKLRHF